MGNQTGNSEWDKDLVKKVLGGDTNAFRHIIQQSEGLVAQMVSRMIIHAEDRKDIVQDIYMKAFHKLAEFRFQSKLVTWIGRIAYNTCINWMEKKKLYLPGDLHDDMHDMPGVADKRNSSEAVMMQKELSGILKKTLDELPPVYQTLVVMYHQEELSYADMMEITGLPEGTIKNYLFRARRALRDDLLKRYDKEDL